jgi:hypothetical protein
MRDLGIAPRMRMTFTDYNGSYTIERECGETIDSVMEELIIPVLLAAGYSRATVEAYLGEG